jgi:CRISPR-associated protein Csm3
MAMIKLLGRLLITGTIHAVTGLHIGGGAAGLAIGGLDNPVVRDPRTRRPYIPGSSLKGRMRSLAERARGFNPDDETQTQVIGDAHIHVCKTAAAYATCPVCPVFGVPGDQDHSTPTRLVVRDVLLDPESLSGAQTDLPFTEIKWENAIDRITSAANPRQIERVPAGALFRGCELVLSFYDTGADRAREFGRIKDLVVAMQLLEDDALGAHGSRGSGKIRFEDLAVAIRRGSETLVYSDLQGGTLEDLVRVQDLLVQWVGDPERLGSA